MPFEILDNKYVSTMIIFFLVIYISLLSHPLPKFVRDLFNNTLFRIFVLFLVVIRGNKDPKMAIMIAIAFVLTLDYMYVMDAKEAFQSIEHMTNVSTQSNQLNQQNRQNQQNQQNQLTNKRPT